MKNVKTISFRIKIDLKIYFSQKDKRNNIFQTNYNNDQEQLFRRYLLIETVRKFMCLCFHSVAANAKLQQGCNFYKFVQLPDSFWKYVIGFLLEGIVHYVNTSILQA